MRTVPGAPALGFKSFVSRAQLMCRTGSSWPYRIPAAAGSGSDDNDCVVLEVFTSPALSCAFFVTPVSADREAPALEHVIPVDAEVGDPLASSV